MPTTAITFGFQIAVYFRESNSAIVASVMKK